MGPKSNVEKWTIFLSSIDPNTSPTKKLTITTENSTEYLARTFAEELCKKNDIPNENQAETPIANGEAQDKGTDNSNEAAGKGARHKLMDDRKGADVSDTSDVKGSSAEIDEKKPNIDEASRNTETPADNSMLVPKAGVKEGAGASNEQNRSPLKKTKIKMGTSCSTWNIAGIAECIDFDKCIAKIKMPPRSSNFLDNIYEMVQKDICRILKVVRGIDMEDEQLNSYSPLLKQLIPITNIETGSRLVLDALLFPLCSVLGLQIEVENKIVFNPLPHCTYDYCIRKGDRIIGCVETKNVTTFKKNSIAQAILQLIVLQENLVQTNKLVSNISELPLFAIVTDGHRFIYMQLKRSSLGFEHHQGKLRVRKVTEYDDFKDIIQHITFLVDEAVQSEF